MMVANQQTMAGNWNELKGRIRSKWGQVTDDALEQSKGNIESLIGTIQRATGEARDSIQSYLNAGASEGAALYKRAGDAVRAGAEQVADNAKYVGDTLMAGAEQTSKVVQSRPLESLLFTFGVGILAGLMVGLVLRSK